MRIFVAGTSFQPTYGGPAYSVSRLAAHLAEAGVEVGLWSPDNSALESPLIKREAGLTPLGGTPSAALNEFGTPDLIHDSGIWLEHNRALAQLAMQRRIPRVVSPRGMLEPWAMNHKWLKKRIAWWLFQKRDLNNTACLHATASSEADQFRKLNLKPQISVIPNGVSLPPPQQTTRPRDGEQSETENSVTKTALFLGRIQSKKGLPMLIEAWSRIKPKDWRMKVVGPDEDGHRHQLERIIRSRGLEEEWEFAPPLVGDSKWGAFSEAQLFILPTHSENFGIAVAEALASGTPVITTHGAPWELLEKERCGWWVPVSVEGIAAALKDATSKDAERTRRDGAPRTGGCRGTIRLGPHRCRDDRLLPLGAR